MLPGNPPSFGNQLPNPGNVAWQQQHQQDLMAQHQEMLALQNHTLHPTAPYDDPMNVDEVGHPQNGGPPPPPTNNIQAAMQGIDRARTAAAASASAAASSSASNLAKVGAIRTARASLLANTDWLFAMGPGAASAAEGGWAGAAAAAEGVGLMAAAGGFVAAAAAASAPALLAGGAALGLASMAGTLWHSANHAAQPSAAADLTRTLVHGHANTGIEQLNGHNGVVQGTASGFQALPHWLQPIPQMGPEPIPIPIYDDSDPMVRTAPASRTSSLATHHLSISQERGRGRTQGGRSRSRSGAPTIAYPARARTSVAPTIAYPEGRATSEAPTTLYPRAREEEEVATPFESHVAKRLKRSTSVQLAPRMTPHPRARTPKPNAPRMTPHPRARTQPKAKAKAKGSAASSSGGLKFAAVGDVVAPLHAKKDVGPLATKPKDKKGK